MDPQLEEPDLRSYLGVLRRRKWLAGSVALTVFGLALAVTLLSAPQYEVSAIVQTRDAADLSAIIAGEGRLPVDLDRAAEQQHAFIQGTEMRFAVGNAYEGPLPATEIWRVEASDVNTREDRTSNVIELSLVSSDPEAARDLVNVYATTYEEKIRTVQQEELLITGARVQAALEDIQERRADVRQPLTELDGQIEQAATDGGNVEALQGQKQDMEEELRPQLDALGQEEAFWRRHASSLALGTHVVNGGGARVLSSAEVPSSPVSPNVPLNLFLGVALGLFAGIAAAFIRDRLDDSVTSKDLVEGITGVPALGLIPRFDTSGSELVAVAASSSPAAEAFRSLRTAVKFLGVDSDVRVVQITSPSAGEGKTVTATNLATVLAQAGDRVVLVGADLRRPRAEEVLGVPMTPGLTGVLIGEVALPQAIRGVDGVPNLSVLPAGQPPPNPSELLSGERARQLVDVLSQTYDMVILDCPPILPVTDSIVLARMSDVTMMVTSVRKTSRRELERAVEVLDQVEARVPGAVITSLDPEEAYAEPYGYESAPRRDRPTRNRLPVERDPDGNLPEGQRPGFGAGPGAGYPEREPWHPDLPQRN